MACWQLSSPDINQTSKEKILKVCKSFGANIYKIERNIEIQQNYEQLKQSKKLLKDAKRQIEDVLYYFTDSGITINFSLIEEYKCYLTKEKLLFLNLNKFQERDDIIYADCWIPTFKEQHVKHQLQEFSQKYPNLPKG